MNSSNSLKTLLAKIAIVLCRDPKRTSIMVILASVMLVLWGRLLVQGGPATATASFIRRSVTAITEPTIANRAPSNNSVLTWLSQPNKPIERNLFAMHLDYYPRGSRSPGNRTGSADENSGDNSGDETTDYEREQRILHENLQIQVGKLKLQSTMMGTEPSALVNGELVKQGYIIAGFTVVKIQPQKMIVQQDGVVLEIVMP